MTDISNQNAAMSRIVEAAKKHGLDVDDVAFLMAVDEEVIEAIFRLEMPTDINLEGIKKMASHMENIWTHR